MDNTARKYNFSTDRYIPVPVSKLIPGKKLGFPLFIHFKRNDHLVLRYAEVDFVSEAHMLMYRTQGFDMLWVPLEYKDAWDRYLHQEAFASDTARSEEAAEVIDILTADDIDADDKFESLSEISKGMLRELASIGSDQPDKAEAAVRRCREFSEDVIRVASKTHEMGNIYEDIAKISAKQLEHSSTVSAYSTMFALALGYADQELLSDIALGGLLHDVGYVALEPAIFDTPEVDYSAEQRKEMQSHVEKGLDLLKKNGVIITANVRLILEEHHERFDGTGYPKGKEGLELSEFSQIVGLADFMDDLMKARIDGRRRSPKEAFEFVGDLGVKSDGGGFFHPEILGIILEIMRRPM